MENPFIITGYIKPEYFCGREKEAERIISKVTSGENMVVMAARRVGKSKLIDFCMDSPAIKDHFICISIDILRTSSIHEFAFELGKAVFDLAARRGTKMLRMVVNTLKSINGCFGYDPISNTPTFNLSLGDISNPLYTLDEIFGCLEQADKNASLPSMNSSRLVIIRRRIWRPFSELIFRSVAMPISSSRAASVI